MRKPATLLLLFSVLCAAAAHAQSGAINVVCEDCRDPLDHPDDWANFAFNQIYGEDAWMDFDQADDFWITNLDGDRVYVDVDYVMKGVNVFGNEVPLWPTNMLQITLVLPSGQVLEVLRSIFMTPLPVPAPSGPDADPDSGGTGGGESGNDGVDEPEPGEEEDPTDPPEIEITGITGIEDPDEDGDFPEPEWCEEC